MTIFPRGKVLVQELGNFIDIYMKYDQLSGYFERFDNEIFTFIDASDSFKGRK
jgi:hypothetical protein